MTQLQLAHAAAVSVPTIHSLERGEGSLRSLISVMMVLDLGWGWIRDFGEAANALSERRRAKGISQHDLAKRVGCCRSTIIALEKRLVGSVSTLLNVLSALGFRQALRVIPVIKVGGLGPATNDPARDLVMTPPALAAAVIAHFRDRMSGRVLDPAKGAGAFFEQFPQHLDCHWCEVVEGPDFHDWQLRANWIMTNPPQSKLRSFTRHAMTIAHHIVWLAPIANLTTKARLRDLEEHGFGIAELVMLDTPEGWPQSGFQLVVAYIQKGYRGAWQISRLT